MERWDAIVCGGGTAGPVLVARLVKAGRRVLLLEAGPDYGPFDGGVWPPELVDSTTIPSTHDWGYTSGGELPGRTLAYERARVIGGCSAHNGCTVSWGHRADFDGWMLSGWSADDLLPLFAEASQRLRTRRFAQEELSPLHRAFIDTGAGLGLPEVDDLDTLDGVAGVCAEPSNSPGGVRWNAAFAYLDPVRASPLLEIRDRALVDRVLIEQGRAVGVRAIRHDGAFEARADLVVLTAGAYGTPAVLLRSGIGPADELRHLGVDVLADNAGVGANLHDHPSFELIYQGTDELDRRDAAFVASGRTVPDEQGFVKVASSRCKDAPFDLHVFSQVLTTRRPGIFVACLTPRSRGQVTLASADPDAPPLLDHRFLSDEEGHDLAVLTDGVTLARDFATQPTLAELLGAEVEPGPKIK